MKRTPPWERISEEIDRLIEDLPIDAFRKSVFPPFPSLGRGNQKGWVESALQELRSPLWKGVLGRYRRTAKGRTQSEPQCFL